MTGYARVRGQDGDLGWSWEVKSVNGRGLELRTRLPAGFDFLEIPARDAVNKRLRRGSVTVGLSVRRSLGPAALVVDETLLARYAALAADVQGRLPDFAPPRIDGLLALRGVLSSGDEQDVAEEAEGRAQTLLAGLGEALDGLIAMRRGEGRHLAATLKAQLAAIADLVKEAGAVAAIDPALVRERLRQQVQALLEAQPALSEERLAQEAALLAVKGDVREELDRLGAHIAAARDLLAAKEPVGRRLDFLCQEFNREANTLCAKAQPIELTRLGLALKAAIEQFREQVQNVE